MMLAIVQIDIGVNFVNRQVRKRIFNLAKHIGEKYVLPIFRKSTLGEDMRKSNRPPHLGFAFSQEPGNAPQVVEKKY